MLREPRARTRCAAAVVLGGLLLTAAPSSPAAESPAPEPPQALFAELFVAVQTQKIYPDGKTFADAIPTEPPDRVLARYRQEQPSTPDALRRFVESHFTLPAELPAPATTSAREPIAAHIDRLWTALTRTTTAVPPYSSLLPLPHPYVVPGGRFRELYYWDSYFTLLGLVQSGRNDLAEDMVGDFAYLIDTYGHVPNGTRTYYLSRSQPPFFFRMAGLLTPDDPAASYARYLPQLRREHAFWMRGTVGLARNSARFRVVRLPDGSILNRFWDDNDSPRDESYGEDVSLARTSHRATRTVYRDIRAAAESGWDFGSRWFADARSPATLDTTDIIPIDLNSLLFGLESAIGQGCARVGDTVCALQFRQRAAHRQRSIDRFLWDEPASAYLDYRWTRHARLPRVSAATLYPLFVALASKSQAAAVARTTAQLLLAPGGLLTSSQKTGQQWDSPNGWAPLQWIAVDGLRHYDQMPLAATIACRWMAGVDRLYLESGKLVEKYDVVDTGRRGGGGEYPTQDGFGWTNGVMRKLMTLYPDAARATACSATP